MVKFGFIFRSLTNIVLLPSISTSPSFIKLPPRYTPFSLSPLFLPSVSSSTQYNTPPPIATNRLCSHLHFNLLAHLLFVNQPFRATFQSPSNNNTRAFPFRTTQQQFLVRFKLTVSMFFGNIHFLFQLFLLNGMMLK